MPIAPEADCNLRVVLYHGLRDSVFAAWYAAVRRCAEERLFPPLYRRRDVRYPAHVRSGCFFVLSGVKGAVRRAVRATAFGMAKRMYYVHNLHLRPDAAKWRRWLTSLADSLCVRYTRRTLDIVAFRMAERFVMRYNISVFYHLARGRVVFVVQKGDDLGDGWEVLRDEVVWGKSERDAGYLREVYAYCPEKRLLLCLHRREVPLPSGRRRLRWVLYAEWWDIHREEAQAIAAGA